MKEKKHIDRIFQEKFKDFEANPPSEMWDKIASELDKKDRKRPFVIPLWFKIGGIAAVIAIIAAGFLFTRNTNSGNLDSPAIVNQPSSESSNSEKERKEQSGSQISNTNEQGTKNVDSSEENNDHGITSSNIANSSIAENKTKTQNKNFSNSTQNPQNSKIKSHSNINSENEGLAINDKNSTVKRSEERYPEKEELVDQPEVSDKAASGLIAKTESEELKDSVNIAQQEENALADLDEKKEESTEELTEESGRRLSLSTFAAPVFYRNLGSGSELSSQLGSNNSVSEVTVSYGVKVAYEISKKIKIRTGISKINVSNTIQDISYSASGLAATGLENINPAGDSFMIRSSSPSNSYATESTMNALVAPLFTPGEINQNFGFIEVPLELEYALIDKKFGLNLIGGASTLFLDENRVDLVSGTTNTRLGEANNINSTSFSTNIGLGMDYDLTDKFSLSVEPIFKYQLNTFNNVQNVQPVNFGIYSGLTIKF